MQSCKSGRTFRIGPGSGLSLSKYFELIESLHTKLFHSIKSNDLFLPWCRFVMFTTVTSVSEVIVIFLQLMLFVNTAAFFYSLLRLVPHSFWEGDSGEEISRRWLCLKEINHSRDSWLAFKSLQAGFHAYSAIIDSFVIVSFFSWETLYSAVLSFTNMLRLCQTVPMFWSRWLLFWVW